VRSMRMTTSTPCECCRVARTLWTRVKASRYLLGRTVGVLLHLKDNFACLDLGH